MKILVVEDDQQVARQIETSLKNAGYVVEVVHDSEEGLYLGSHESFDAVILDLNLPKIDGIKVLQQWRNDNRSIPVLILTARDT